MDGKLAKRVDENADAGNAEEWERGDECGAIQGGICSGVPGAAIAEAALYLHPAPRSRDHGVPRDQELQDVHFGNPHDIRAEISISNGIQISVETEEDAHVPVKL